MKTLRLSGLLCLLSLAFFQCKKDTVLQDVEQQSRVEESSLPDGITAIGTTNASESNPTSDMEAYACWDHANFFQMGLAKANGGIPDIYTFTEPQIFQSMLWGGWSQVQAQKANNAMFHNPATGTPLMAYNVAGVARATIPIQSGVLYNTYFGNSYAFNLDYTYPSFCDKAYIDNYFLGYSKPAPNSNYLIGLVSANNFVVENNVTGETHTVNFGSFANIVNAMIASQMSVSEVNTFLSNMANGTVTAATFWDMMARIAQYFPGTPVGNHWRLRQVYQSLLFTAPVISSVRYVICGNADYNCSVE